MSRRKPTGTAEQEVLIASRRRCALCFGLRGELSEKLQGQLAHVDRDHSNSVADNLCYLCLLHHDAYDTKSTQSKNLTEGELRHYRDALYEYLKTPDALRVYFAQSIARPVENSPFFTLTSNSFSAGIMDFQVRNDGAPVTCVAFDAREDIRGKGVKVGPDWYPPSLPSGETFRAKVALSTQNQDCVFVMRVRDRGGLERTYELRLDRHGPGPSRFDFLEIA
jgi:hypothetical protein